MLLHGQSPDIAMGVNAKNKGGNLGEQEGAGDQGLMFGFACRDSEEYEKNSFMPAPIYFSHKILEVLSKARRSGELKDLQPDAKSQVTVRYVDGKAVGCGQGRGLNAAPREANAKGKKYNSGLIKEMIAGHVAKSLPKGWMPKKAVDFFVNPTGHFVVGGPDGDCGLTGRKIIVDTYGGMGRMAAAPFPAKIRRRSTGRRPTARYLAKNVVAAGLAGRGVIEFAYAIGVAEPVSLYGDT